MKHIHKVFAYVTHRQRLLVFVHPRHPEAGIQVPAGTLDIGESPEAGILREVREETGLTDLAMGQFLGEQTRDMTDYGHAEIHLRRFYHVLCTCEPPDTWRYFEQYPSRSPGEAIPFDFFWVPLPHGVPRLVADHGVMVPRLIECLRLSERLGISRKSPSVD